ncbi:MAG: class I mannose-6-phosphate isomerase, partial [Bacteroidales bacterium]|nr:class I mannose-6-phosphate isomerase [Bacteroidales bacterium]
FLDIRERLSVQVHPTDEIALERYDSLGKTEFWYVVDAAPDAKVYMGFNRDVTAQEFYDACKAETAPSLMNVYNPKPGDCFYIKAGTVHAAEGNVLIAEVQENSDATLRLYDWGYENNPATRREMHLDEAIDCIDYCKYKADELYIPAARAKDVICRDRYFTIKRIELASEVEVNTDNYTSFIVYMCIDGAASLKWDGGVMEIEKGDTILVPASLTDFSLQPKGLGTILIEASIDEMKEEGE